MKTKKLFDGLCCSAPTAILALLAIFMPFVVAADVLGASALEFSAFYKIGVVVLILVAFLLMYRQSRLA